MDRDGIWDGMTAEARNAAYNNVAHVGPDVARAKTEGWLIRSGTLRAQQNGHLDLPYAGAARTRWDLYPAEDPSAPCLIHIHGGYWQRGSKETFACLTEGVRAHGWSAALPGYTLAPEAGLTEIVAELRQALDWFAAHAGDHGITGPVILSGWSAGGHLTALLLDHPAVTAGLCVSGVFDLGHLRDSPHVNDKLQLTEAEVRDLSPVRRPMVEKPLAIAYGGCELPAMIATSRHYHQLRSEAARPGALIAMAGRNHFTILDDLLDAEGALVAAIRGLA